MSGMPNNARPFHGNTKNVHHLCLFLWLNVTLQIPNCKKNHYFVISFMVIYPCFCCCQLLIFSLGNKILKIWYGIILPSLHASILYCIIVLFWLQLVFSFAICTDHMFSKLKKLKFTESICLSVIVSYSTSCTVPFLSLLLLHTMHKLFNLPHPWYIFPYVIHFQGGWLKMQCLDFFLSNSQYFCFSEKFSFCTTFALYDCDSVALKFIFSLKLSMMFVSTLCASILLAHTRTCSLITQLMSFIAESS